MVRLALLAVALTALGACSTADDYLSSVNPFRRQDSARPPEPPLAQPPPLNAPAAPPSVEEAPLAPPPGVAAPS